MTGHPAASSRRRLLARGIAWNSLYQGFDAGLAFGAMLILARIIPPAEYGRVGVVVGVVALLNAFGSSVFLAHSLQVGDDAEPDWSLHWSAGFYIQALLMVVCHVLAGLGWLTSAYRPVAPVLHLAAFGLILDWPAQLRTAMLRRDLNFGRLKVLSASSALARVGVTLGVGLVGGGAYAIVLGSNVIATVPFAIDLLLVQRWQPRPGWWRWPDWAAYRPTLYFGFQQAVSVLFGTARGALAVVVLPGAVGYAGIGLLNRAQALSGMTVGRLGNVIVETVYPVLPRYGADAALYARQATIFAQVLFLTVVPGSLFVGLEGRLLSRVLYGQRWIEADPLIWPAALAGLGLGVFSIALGILLGANRLRSCLILDGLAAALSLPMVAVAWTGGGIVAYSWAVAAGQLVAGAIALAGASPRLAPGWIRSALLPPALGSFLAMGAVLSVQEFAAASSYLPQLGVGTCVYAVTLGLTLRAFFPGALATVLGRIPGGDRLGSWVGLPAPPVSAVPE